MPNTTGENLAQFGSFPSEGGVWFSAPHPVGYGYGGTDHGFSPYSDLTFSLMAAVSGGYGGYPYGHGPYGSTATNPRPSFPVSGGYGGSPYGLGPYGTTDDSPPSISSAISLDGTRIEIFFSEEMFVDGILLDPSNYGISVLSGGASSSAVSVSVGVTGTWGATSVVLTHTGTTLGGVYQLTLTDITDLAGNPIQDLGGNTINLIALGDPATFTVTPVSGSQILFDFSEDMLPETTFSGLEQASSYDIQTTYPVPLTLDAFTHPNGSDASQVLADVTGQTSANYDVTITPATAIDYDGSILPNASGDFTGTEVGTGTSQIIVSDLSLSKLSGSTYGWEFADTSGRVLPNSSFRVDFSFDASSANYIPPLFDAVLGTFTVNDGAIEANCVIERIGGIDVVTVNSGAYSQSVNASWSSGPSTLSLVRNQVADTYTVLFNGTPLLSTATANFTGSPSISSGAQFLLSTTYEIDSFLISDLQFTSTQTVFTAIWNFLHNQSASFTGSSAQTKSSFFTRKGPLTKGWGDGTPATENDVTLTVNGTAVDVSEVNPYTGEITPTIPIPLTPSGTVTVEVDYTWFPVPIMEMAGLNTEGLVLNKWDLPKGLQYPPYHTGEDGAVDDSRFQMRIVLGPIERPTPKWIGHRYLGFERDYTASLNSPVTLLLNQDPHSIKVEDFEAMPSGVSVGYVGETEPISEGWSLRGQDNGQVNSLEGTYTLIDESSGSFDEGEAGFYVQDIDLSFPSSVVLASRFQIDEYTLDGVFTGVGFGFHNNRRLYVVGALVVNGVRHVGLLTQPSAPQDVDSWAIGPSVSIDIQDETTFSVSTSDFPASVEPGDRFQILAGSQSGVYTIEDFVNQTDGTTTVTLESTTTFPADPFFWENDTAEATFEVLWGDALTTFRMVADTLDGGVQVFVSGEISAEVISLETMPEVPLAAQTAFLFSTEGLGEVFWGSLDRLATSDSTWSFFRYGVTPQQTTFNSLGEVVSSAMGVLPQEDPNSEWFLTEDFGYSEVDSSGNTLLLKSTAADPTQDITYGYARIEPFISPNVHVDVDGVFRVDTGTLGFGDAQVRIEDKNREVRFGTVLYREDSGGTPFRQLITMPSASLSGIFTPEGAGWTSGAGLDITASARSQKFTTVQAIGQSGTWYTDLDLTGINFPDEGGRILEARFAVSSYTSNGSGGTGIIFGGEVGDNTTNYLIAATLIDAVGGNPARVALTSNGTPIQTFDFDWTDGEEHTYRILVDYLTATVTLVVDDTVQTPTVSLPSFDTASQNTMVFLGAFNLDTAHTVVWDSISSTVTPPSDAKRTLGVWLGGDLDDIDNYQIPRTDATGELNSSNSAVVEEMDWRSDIEFRVHRDAEWGVIIQRPDLALPPFYTGQFATEITEPTSGWISVEYPKLPILGTLFGSISWGSLDSQSITQQRWSEIRYRVYDHITDDFRSPRGMVLNRQNVLTSGEDTQDITPEVVQVTSLSSTLVSLRPTDIYAQTVFSVIDDDTIIPFENWQFDFDTQSIQLDSPLSGENVPVTVVFGPGKPTTKTYLEAQPLLDSITLLNDSTPIFQKTETGDSTPTPTFGSKFNDPNDNLNVDADFIFNDPYVYLDDVEDPDSIYECMDFIEVDNGGEEGLLSPICDDSYCGSGLIDFSLDGGLVFSEVFKTPKEAFTNIAGAGFSPPTLSPGGTTTGQVGPSGFVSSYPTLHISGGNFVDGTLGPGTSLLIQNYPSLGLKPSGDSQPLNKVLTISLSVTTVVTDNGATEIPLEEDFDFANTISDNTPPSFSTDPDLVPDGTDGSTGNGAALALLTVPGDYGRIGPWAGLADLEDDSLLAGGSADTSNSLLIQGGTALPGETSTVISIEAAN